MNNAQGKIVVTGGSGFLGINLAHALLKAGYEVCIVSRGAPRQSGGWKHVPWDARSVGSWADELEGAAAVVNLAGRSVDCVHTPDNCDAILRSRVETTRLVGAALRRLKTPPQVWVQMSTAHIYGDSLDAQCTEDSAHGFGLAPFVGQAWEQAFDESVLPGMRKVVLRTSLVLGRSGGALQRLAGLAKLGLGGAVGHGRQGMSWIHEEDMNELFMRFIIDESMKGVYVATAPNPISNSVFMAQLRKAVKMPVGLPAFAWMVKIAAPLIMKTNPDLALYGRYCVSRRLKEEGFEFKHPEIGAALADLYSGNSLPN